MTDPVLARLSECLANTTRFLQAGDAVAAAKELAGIQAQSATLPSAAAKEEVQHLRELLAQCMFAGDTLRNQVTSALQTLGAGRKGMTYR